MPIKRTLKFNVSLKHAVEYTFKNNHFSSRASWLYGVIPQLLSKGQVRATAHHLLSIVILLNSCLSYCTVP